MRAVRPVLAIGVCLAALLVSMAAGAMSAGGETLQPQAPSGQVAGNGLIAFTSNRSGNNEIWTTYPDGQRPTNLTNNSASDTDPAWSADGTKIAFVSDRAGESDIWVMNADGSGATNLTQLSGATNMDPAWSPNGSRILFTSNRSGDNQVWVMNSNGTGASNVSQDPGFSDRQAVFATPSLVIFVSNRTGNDEIFRMSITGTGKKNLSNDPGFSDTQPAISPTGKWIAFVTNRTGDDEVFAMASDGTQQANVSVGVGFSDQHPSFSPDGGTRVLFSSDRTGDPEVTLISFFNGQVFGSYIDVVHNTAIDSQPSWQPLPAPPPNGSPIQHVVVIYQENHTFDDVLGKFCAVEHPGRCDGATSGKVSDGSTVTLQPAPDVVPNIGHGAEGMILAINGGQMDQFDLLSGCQAPRYVCYMTYDVSEIPTLASLANQYVISDRTFASRNVASFGAHIEIVASGLDGFTSGGFIQGGPGGNGWGCDSGLDQRWFPTVFDTVEQWQPTCIPQKDGTGPYRPSPVPWVPTIMDRMDQAGLTWKLYAPQRQDANYGWAMCPTFAACFKTQQRDNWVPQDQFIADAAAGTLPNYSVIVPTLGESQHNRRSMLTGDNWIRDNVNAVMNGPDWLSTAIFITYDDCGCFYDHVPPPDQYLGIREPMVIVSPYAVQGYTDHEVATFSSMLAYVEHTFGLAPLNVEDATVYDYSNSFDYTQRPLAPIDLPRHRVPEWVNRWIEAHPGPGVEEDPT